MKLCIYLKLRTWSANKKNSHISLSCRAWIQKIYWKWNFMLRVADSHSWVGRVGGAMCPPIYAGIALLYFVTNYLYIFYTFSTYQSRVCNPWVQYFLCFYPYSYSWFSSFSCSSLGFFFYSNSWFISCLHFFLNFRASLWSLFLFIFWVFLSFLK